MSDEIQIISAAPVETIRCVENKAPPRDGDETEEFIGVVVDCYDGPEGKSMMVVAKHEANGTYSLGSVEDVIDELGDMFENAEMETDN